MWSVDAHPANPAASVDFCCSLFIPLLPLTREESQCTHIQHSVHFQHCICSSSDVVRDFRGDERHYKASLVRQQRDGKEAVVVVLGEEEEEEEE